MVMTAHVLYPAIDPILLATLSPRIVQGALRSDMGYSGIVITDDLDMGAVSRSYRIEECALRAVAAGDDILLICNHPEKAFAARSRLVQAIRDGELSEQRVRESLARIEDLKRRYRTSMKPCAKEAVHGYFEAV